MATADVVLGTERAASQSIQLMGDETDNIPSGCSSTGPEEDTVTTFGANGIIGVGPFIQDCGADCTTSTESGIYWSCPAGGGTCGQTVVTLAQQASNPVAAFTTDNNGIILELPSIPDAGAASAAGALVFGIGTESNNALGSASVFGTDDEAFININYKNFTYTEGFIDSGSNLNYFNDGTITTCASGSASIFCPSSELTETALVEGASGSPQVSVTFNVSNPETLEENEPSFTAFDNVAAPPLATPVTSSLESSEEFDLGLPFFYGRNIFTAIEGMNTTGGGEGPYFAF
jgi:hypothetical protein